MVTLLGKPRDEDAPDAAAAALAALALRLEPVDVVKCFDALVAVIGKGFGGSKLVAMRVNGAGEGLRALASRLDAAVATNRFDTLIELINSSNLGTREAAGVGIIALVPRLEPADRTFDTLLAALQPVPSVETVNALADSLKILAPRLNAMAADRAFDALVDILDTPQFHGVVYTVGWSLAALAPRLNPTTAQARLSHAATKIVRYDAETANPAMVAIAPRLASANLVEAVDMLVAIFGNVKDVRSNREGEGGVRVAGNGLAALAPWLDPATARKVLDTLEALQPRLLNQLRDDYLCGAVLALLPRLVPAERSERLHRVLRRILDYDRWWASVRTHRQDGGGATAFLLAVDRIESVPFLCEMLRDPGCVGELQSAVLFRLEQFAHPEPAQAAVFVGLAADPRAVLALPAVHLADDNHRRQNRRFRTVSDAAKWLAAHHPEIDLDRPYRKSTPSK